MSSGGGETRERRSARDPSLRLKSGYARDDAFVITF